MTALLQVEAVTRSFGGVNALDAVSLEVAEHRMTGVIGPNGSGKTTLVNILTRLIDPNEGTVSFGGIGYTTLPAHDVVRLGIARSFQNIRLLSNLSVLENVQLGFHRLTSDSNLLSTWLRRPSHRRVERDTREQSAAILERLGVVGLASRRPSELPYGLQRRVEIGRALASSPRLLLLDEPTAGMSWPEAVGIAEVLRQVNESGMTIVIIEHNVRLLRDFCDEMVALSNGRLIASGPPDDVLNHRQVIESYLGRGATGHDELA